MKSSQLLSSEIRRERTGRSTASATSHKLTEVVMPSSKVVFKQPQPVMDSRVSNEWGSGICDCCDDVPQCCFACWCCPCFACKTSRDYGQPLCLPLLEVFGGCIAPINMALRVHMRERYGIKGTVCKDCVYASCCPSCSWCQMSREIKRRKIQVVLVSAKNT